MDCLMLLALASDQPRLPGARRLRARSDGRIRRRKVEQEMVPFAFTGVSLAHPRLFEGSPEGAFSLNVVWNRAIAAGRAYGDAHGGHVDACRDAGGAGGSGAVPESAVRS